MQTVLDERERKFQVEVERTQANMNRLIEESIRDKQLLDDLEVKLVQRDK